MAKKKPSLMIRALDFVFDTVAKGVMMVSSAFVGLSIPAMTFIAAGVAGAALVPLIGITAGGAVVGAAIGYGMYKAIPRGSERSNLQQTSASPAKTKRRNQDNVQEKTCGKNRSKKRNLESRMAKLKKTRKKISKTSHAERELARRNSAPSVLGRGSE